MLKCYYLKGLTTTKEELEILRKKFLEEGILLIPVVDDYDKLSLSKDKIFAYLDYHMRDFVNNDDINLVCHSIGCNFGAYLALNNSKIKKLVLVSPEFVSTKKDEKEEIKRRKVSYINEEENIKVKRIKELILFLKSRGWGNDSIKELIKSNKEILLMYSKGDINVSQKYINELKKNENVMVSEIISNNHNPLLVSPSAILDIKLYLKK